MSHDQDEGGAAGETAAAELDASGLLCPLPVLKLRKRLQALSCGAVIRMRTDDPAARIDVPHFCAEQGHALLGEPEETPDGALAFLVRKGG
ncbi:MAG: sulfurtransferase TusA family protein [Pseudomonadota bacterium]